MERGRERGKRRDREKKCMLKICFLDPPFFKILALLVFSLFLNFPICKKQHNHPSNKKWNKNKNI
jgi:hypothetical protein